MTSTASQQLRECIVQFIGELPIPATTVDEAPRRRSDGVLEFTKHWCVRGTQREGVFASLVDQDDVIELGLFERAGDYTINLLHVTVVLDSADAEAEINCLSETRLEYNFNARISPTQPARLRQALGAFADGLRGAAA